MTSATASEIDCTADAHPTETRSDNQSDPQEWQLQEIERKYYEERYAPRQREGQRLARQIIG